MYNENMNAKDLNLDEKLILLCGKEHSMSLETLDGKLPSITMSDGPHGLRTFRKDENGKSKAVPATAMPSLTVIANSWNKEAAKTDGGVLGDECIDNGIDLLLAPGVNIKRSLLCGRNFEYFSEDPYLAGTMAKSYIEGVQGRGVGVSLKHFCLNNLETERAMQSSECDERTMREIYVKPFEIALQAKPWTVMASYNPVNGVYACENPKLLTKLLREELGFKGVVVSDWNAVHSAYKSLRAGLDLRMPYDKNNYNDLKSAYEKGYITDRQIDDAVDRIIELLQKNNTFEKKVCTLSESRHEYAVKIAEEGLVLLKNQGNILPLKGGKQEKIAVIGYLAAKPAIGGGGSSAVPTEYDIPSLSDALRCRCESEIGYEVGVNELSFSNAKDAYSLAFGADAVIIVVGEGADKFYEGGDRDTIRLRAEQEKFILETAKYNDNVIAVIESGDAVDVSAFESAVKAIIFAGYAGEGVNEALADIILGKTCPSGKLSQTFPTSLESSYMKDCIGDGVAVFYSEGVFVGYRYYDKYDIPVRYEFGFGLSYAKFKYSDLRVVKTGDTDFTVSYTISNVSSVDGKEVSQVYVRDVVALVARPLRELKGYSKDLIKAGESKRIEIKLDFGSFAYYSTVYDKWLVENGVFEIEVGASSRDIRLKQSVKIQSDDSMQPSQNAMFAMIG